MSPRALCAKKISIDEGGPSQSPPFFLGRSWQRCSQGCCFHHVQAIIVSIDQYAEAALGNRGYFLNRPHGIGGQSDNIP
jgi:hypothetical protein